MNDVEELSKSDQSSRGRIAPEQVVEAYRRTGLEPIQHEFYIPPERGHPACGCGLTAVVVDRGGDPEDHPTKFREVLGISQHYFNGFVNGFDDIEDDIEIDIGWS